MTQHSFIGLIACFPTCRILGLIAGDLLRADDELPALGNALQLTQGLQLEENVPQGGGLHRPGYHGDTGAGGGHAAEQAILVAASQHVEG